MRNQSHTGNTINVGLETTSSSPLFLISSAGSLITSSKHFNYLWESFTLLGKSGPSRFKSRPAPRCLEEPPDLLFLLEQLQQSSVVCSERV